MKFSSWIRRGQTFRFRFGNGIKIISFIILLLLSPTDISAAGWKAGVGRVKITPEESMWLAGYAARNKASEGVLQDLWAKALVLEDAEGNRCVLVTADLIGFSKTLSDRIRKQLDEQLGLDKSRIILNASHTHSGPVLLQSSLAEMYPPFSEDEKTKMNRYGELLERRIVEMVVKAAQAPEPVTVSAANGICRMQVNRRNNSEGKLTALTELKGPNDYAVPVLKVTAASGTVKAVAFGYACHPTVLDQYLWSGDYPGFAQEELEKTYPGAVALFFQGAGADQNPLPRRSIPLAKQYGLTLAAAVDRTLQEPMTTLPATLKTAYKEVPLPLDTYPATHLAEIVRSDKQPDYLKRCAKHLLTRYRDGEPPMRAYPYPVQAWNLGGRAMFVLGGELTVGYSVGLKRKYGESVFVLGYSNDLMGYIPTLTVLKEGGYEGGGAQILYGLPGRWTPDVETVILEAVDETAKQAGIAPM